MDFKSSLSGVRRANPSPSGANRRAKRHFLRPSSSVSFGARPINNLQSAYPSALTFYDSLPGGDIGLADFETLALERLNVLRVMEKCAALSVHKYSMEWADKVLKYF